ncbi:hypothetical protein CR513_19028, partial [Mucuna pruriens]
MPLSFPTQSVPTRKAKSDEELLKMFRKVEINIPLLEAIKQILKYAKFLKELCMHKRKKMKGSVEVGGIVSVLTKNEEVTTGAQALPKKCGDPKIFSVPCTIGECTFANAMLDLGASINVMSMSIYKSLNFGGLERTGMIIQLANISVVQPLGILEDVLVQVNKLIFPPDFYVLDMEDKTFRQGSTLILGRPFLMTARTKIDVHVGTFSMEFGDTLVQFNIFEAMKHPTEDHSLFSIDILDELVEEYFQLDSQRSIVEEEADYAESREVHSLSDSMENNNDIADLDFKAELLEVLDQELTTTIKGQDHVSTPSAELNSSRPIDPKISHDNSSSPLPPMELKPLPKHLKYAYLDTQQQLPEDKLLQFLRQQKKTIGWKLSNLPRINPSTCLHRILLEETAKPIRQ